MSVSMNLARTAGLFYVLTIAAGSWALVGAGPGRLAANGIAATSYVAVTVLFFFLFRPVHARASLLAAAVGLAGCSASALAMSGVWRPPFNALGLFGIYCLLIAWLIARSTLPRALGVLMALGGLGWLTFLVPSVARALAPYNFAPGIVGETLLTGWLLMTGTAPRRRAS
jgi:Domain of unknown function (DUF4386)